MTVGERIERARRKAGISFEELSKITDLGQVTLEIYEKAYRETDFVSISAIEKIASALNISPAVLVGWEKPRGDAEKQLNAMISKQKAMVATEQDETRRNVLIAMWVSILNGLKLTNAIDTEEYKKQYDKLQKFVERIGEHEKYQKKSVSIARTGYGYEFKGKCQGN